MTDDLLEACLRLATSSFCLNYTTLADFIQSNSSEQWSEHIYIYIYIYIYIQLDCGVKIQGMMQSIQAHAHTNTHIYIYIYIYIYIHTHTHTHTHTQVYFVHIKSDICSIFKYIILTIILKVDCKLKSVGTPDVEQVVK